ncbi:hypothetical protein ACFSJW_07640, partial [Flavobacterium artemisiae]|uniref:hypothetical protein n=1 Tax=Flavobacterium artemisiae TaxID=2126556 RepID=UPI00362D985E
LLIRLPASISMNVFASAGAKVEPLFTFSSLFFIFFQCFLKLFLNSLVTAPLQSNVFSCFVGFFLFRVLF